MSTSNHPRQRAVKPTTHSQIPTSLPMNPSWRCTRCDKLLGRFNGEQLHLSFARGPEYFVSLPAMATCRGCGTLNRAAAPGR